LKINEVKPSILTHRVSNLQKKCLQSARNPCILWKDKPNTWENRQIYLSKQHHIYGQKTFTASL